MAIKLPELQRARPQAPGSVGQMNVQGPDLSQAEAMNNNTIGKVLGGASEMAMKFEDDAAKMESTKAHYEASLVFRRDIEKGKTIEGDPTEYYSKMRESWKEFDNSVMEKYANSSDYSKKFIRQRLDQARQEADIQASTTEVIQRDRYDDKLTSASRELYGDGMVSQSAGLKLEKDKDGNVVRDENGRIKAVADDAFFGVRDQLLKVKQVTQENQERKGLIMTNTEGKKVFSPLANQEMKVASSAQISKVIKAYQLAGDVDRAEFIMQEYGSDILEKDRTKLKTVQDDTQVEIGALTYVDKAMNGRDLEDEADMYEDLENIKDVRVKDVAMKKLKTRIEQKRSVEKHQATKARDDISMTVMDILKTQQKNGPVTITADSIWDIPEIKRHEGLSKLNVKDRRGIEQIVTQPKTSDPVALQNAYKALREGKFETMSEPEFFATLTGISGPDRNPLLSARRKITDPNTPAQEKVRTKQLEDELEMQMIGLNLIKRQPFGREFNKDDTAKIIQYRNEMIAINEKFGSSPKDIAGAMKEWLVKKKSGEVFTGVKPKVVFNPVVDEKKPTAARVPLTPEQKKKIDLEALALWQDTYKRPFTSTDSPKKLQELYENSVKKKVN